MVHHVCANCSNILESFSNGTRYICSNARCTWGDHSKIAYDLLVTLGSRPHEGPMELSVHDFCEAVYSLVEFEDEEGAEMILTYLINLDQIGDGVWRPQEDCWGLSIDKLMTGLDNQVSSVRELTLLLLTECSSINWEEIHEKMQNDESEKVQNLVKSIMQKPQNKTNDQFWN